MFTKFMALATFACSVVIFLFYINGPSNPLFYVMSGGLAICIARLALTAALVVITSIKIPYLLSLRIALGIFGIPLIIFGMAGFFTNSFDDSWYGFIKPFDFLLIAESGIIMNILALQPEQPAVHWPRFHFHFDFELLPTRDRALLISAFSIRTKRLNTMH